MSDFNEHPLAGLAKHIASRREEILKSWHEQALTDPQQTTVGFLTRSQFNDHIPELLDAFQRRLRTGRDGGEHPEEVKHGLQRWQQGYRLSELMREWGHLNQVLFQEVESYASHAQMGRPAFNRACERLFSLITDGITESTSQYDRMRQAEAEGHLADLKQALSDLDALNRRRAELIHQAVHDLRTNLQSVSSAADFFVNRTIPEKERIEVAQLLQRELESVSGMLGELMALARLEAGQEQRAISAFDASHLIRDAAAAAQPQAAGRGLFLRTEGPDALEVEGDPGKVQRILQNLLSNAINYTEVGGITLSWGTHGGTWWFSVQDTGPGLRAGPNSPIAGDLLAATDSAREAEAADPGQGAGVLPPPAGGAIPAARNRHPHGEGIGLSIVKRLCELLDASVEMTSSATVGTVFRVVLPRRY